MESISKTKAESVEQRKARDTTGQLWGPLVWCLCVLPSSADWRGLGEHFSTSLKLLLLFD